MMNNILEQKFTELNKKEQEKLNGGMDGGMLP